MINFFIRRPVFACVIALLMLLVGGLSIFGLPIELFPQIVPPQVSVTSNYPGANAEVVSDVVTSPIERAINGVEGMIYMSSVSTNNGDSNITVTFDVGYDINVAAVDVQNKTENAKPLLPDVVSRTGISVDKVSNNFALVVNLTSPNNTYDSVYLGNYADLHVTDEIARVFGVGQVMNFGLLQYSMRIWLDPDKMASQNLTAMDVSNAISAENVEVAAGKVGAPPYPGNQIFEYQINTQGRLSQVSEFEDIIVKTTDNGALVRVKDVARVELGADSYESATEFNGQTTATIGVLQLPGANTLNISKNVHALMERLQEDFPEDIEYHIVYDTSNYVVASLTDLIKTLFEAIVLVVFVVLVFLQTGRATLIPVIAIPVSLIGAFALMFLFGFSINTLSLLGLVLAIGLVVDDAIVVVENVQRRLEEGHKDITTAVELAMEEVKGPIIATTLVLMAVFIPVAFIPGTTGRLYQQFALTIAFSVGLSGVNSLTLSPALCRIFLRQQHGETNFAFFRWFNRVFESVSHWYQNSMHTFVRYKYIVLACFLILGVMTYGIFKTLPHAFVPAEDQGWFIVGIQGPDATTLERTRILTSQALTILENTPGVANVISISGFNFIDGVNQPNAGIMFVILDPWDDRKSEDLHVTSIIDRVSPQLFSISNGLLFAANAPPILGLDPSGGFQFEIEDRGNAGLGTLATVTDNVWAAASQRSELTMQPNSFSNQVPQYFLDIDRTRVAALGIDISEVFNTLETFIGSFYVDDFNLYNRRYRVILQAEGIDRNSAEDIFKLYVRNKDMEMVPLGAIASISPITGPYSVKHYNLYTSAVMAGAPSPGYSSGEAIAAMEAVADEVLPDGFSYEWTGSTYQEIAAGNLAPIIFALSLVFVFLFLAAQYESWIMPVIILLAVPLAMLGAAAAIKLRASVALDVYAQIGLVMLIGLSAKNSILIVEFAKRRRNEGLSIMESAIQAAKVRLRPIIMTAFAFILGVLPLVFATGAGAVSRQSIGTTVVGGMIVATFLTLIIVPVFYVLIETMREKEMEFVEKHKHEHDEDEGL